jgi:hypothetical protein
MLRLQQLFAQGRIRKIVVKLEPDHICRSCPHLEHECAPRHLGPRGNAAADLDRAVLRALRLKPGFRYTWPEMQQRIADLTGTEFATMCQLCGWRELGMCGEAHRRLKEELSPPSDNEMALTT